MIRAVPVTTGAPVSSRVSSNPLPSWILPGFSCFGSMDRPHPVSAIGKQAIAAATRGKCSPDVKRSLVQREDWFASFEPEARGPSRQRGPSTPLGAPSCSVSCMVADRGSLQSRVRQSHQTCHGGSGRRLLVRWRGEQSREQPFPRRYQGLHQMPWAMVTGWGGQQCAGGRRRCNANDEAPPTELARLRRTTR